MRLFSPEQVQRIAFALLWVGGVSVVVIVLAIVGYVLLSGLGAIELEFLLTTPRGGLAGEGGISTVIVTTLYLIVLTLAIAGPLGIGAAIYFSEYAPVGRFTQITRFGVETLAGVPSIVFGLFGYLVFVGVLGFGFSILAGAASLALLVLPTVIRTAEEALRAVPQSYREASFALGATRWQTVSRVILPAALAGVVTGIILTVGRTIGESAVVFVTIGATAFRMPTSVFDEGRPLALHVYYLAMETRAFDKAMATAAILILIILLINFSTGWISRRLVRGTP